jgi:hypothetical protein
MAQLSTYIDNPYWAKMRNYALSRPPNNGFYKRWVQGSAGMNDGMPIYSNEYSYLILKHGENEPIPYRGNIKYFSPSVTDDLRNQVEVCSSATTDNVGCQVAAIRSVFTRDAHRVGYGKPPQTAHPFNVSYMTGYSPGEVAIPPDGKCHT